MNKDTKKDKFCCYSEKLLGKLLGELSGKRRTTVLIKKKYINSVKILSQTLLVRRSSPAFQRKVCYSEISRDGKSFFASLS